MCGKFGRAMFMRGVAKSTMRVLLCMVTGVALTTTATPTAKKSEPATTSITSITSTLTFNAIHSTAHQSSADNLTREFTLPQFTKAPTDTTSHRVLDKQIRCTSVVCYDYRDTQVRVPIARTLMPSLPGLKKENLSIKRDQISLQYSF